MVRLPRVALASLLLLAPLVARAETFDYTVDRFEADGNVNGPLDGTPDVIDEFDDGVLSPWYIRRGSASETGGLAHVTSPGLDISLPGVFPVSFEASAIGTSNRLHTGNGDAVLRVVLPQQAILANDAVSFDLATIEGQALYYGGIVLTNFNSSLASQFTPPYPVGLAATAHLESISFTNESLVHQHHPIVPSAVTGPIVLELRYDDAARTMTPAVSVDGGGSYEFVFDPVDVETDSGDVVVQVAVAALDGSCPASHYLRQANFSGIGGGPGRQRLKLRSAFPSLLITDRLQPVRLLVTDEGAGGATLFDVAVPSGAEAFQHACDPRDRWVGQGYVNKSNALPPACVPGSANGLKRMKYRWNGTLDLRVQIAGATLPSVVGPVRLTIYDGTEPVNECDGWVGESTCRPQSGKSVRCP
jgi:hypothetical protein